MSRRVFGGKGSCGPVDDASDAVVRSKRFGARTSWHHLNIRFRYRAIAGVLTVALPITILLGVLLTRSASSSLTASARRSVRGAAFFDLCGLADAIAQVVQLGAAHIAFGDHLDLGDDR